MAAEQRDPSARRKRYSGCWRSPRLSVGCPRLLQSLHSPNPGRRCRFRAVLSLSLPAAHPRLRVRRSAPGSGHGYTEGPSGSPSQGERCGFEWGLEALERRGSERARVLGKSIHRPPPPPTPPSPAPELGVLPLSLLPEAPDPLGVGEVAVVQWGEVKPRASVKSAGLQPGLHTQTWRGTCPCQLRLYLGKGTHRHPLCLLSGGSVLFETGSVLCSSGFPEIGYVDQTGLELPEIHQSVPLECTPGQRAFLSLLAQPW